MAARRRRRRRRSGGLGMMIDVPYQPAGEGWGDGGGGWDDEGLGFTMPKLPGGALTPLLLAGAAGAVYYFFLRKPSMPAAVMIPRVTTPMPVAPTPQQPVAATAIQAGASLLTNLTKQFSLHGLAGGIWLQ